MERQRELSEAAGVAENEVDVESLSLVELVKNPLYIS